MPCLMLAAEQPASPPSAPLPSPEQPVLQAGFAPLTDDTRFQADEARVWHAADGSEWLDLRGGVRLVLGGRVFVAEQAAIRFAPSVRGERDMISVLRQAQVVGAGEKPVPGLTLTARIAGVPRLVSPRMVQGVPVADPFISAAEACIDAVMNPPKMPVKPIPQKKSLFPSVDDLTEAARRSVESLGRGDGGLGRPTPALPRMGGIEVRDRMVRWSNVRVQPNPDGPGHVAIVEALRLVLALYDPQLGETTVEMQADKAVMFMDGPDVQSNQLRQLYLEGNVVVSDGAHTLRAPRVYFDLQRHRSLILDPVLVGAIEGKQSNFYIRARSIHGQADDAFTAYDVSVANSPFAVPLVAVQSRRLSVMQTLGNPGGKSGSRVAMESPRLQVEGATVLTFPSLQLASMESVMKSLEVKSGGAEGTRIETSWDLYNLAGIVPPDSRDSLTGRLDWRDEHGVALGADWHVAHVRTGSEWSVYSVPYDQGIDAIPGRLDVPHDAESRQFIGMAHRQRLGASTELQLTGHWASDPSFEETFRRESVYTQRPPDTGARIQHVHDDWMVSLAASVQLDDFTPDLAQWQSKGWQTERMEAGFHRLGTEWFEGRMQWYSENRVGEIRPALRGDLPSERGMTDAQAQTDLGLPNANTSMRDAWWAAGLPVGWITRVDSRQEVQVPLVSGPVNWVPWAMVRYTRWNDSVAASPMVDESQRLMGGLGIRSSSEWVGPSHFIQSTSLDLDGLRHVVRLEGDVGMIADTSDSTDLPLLDPDVEGVQDGAYLRMGYVSALQTHRGMEANRRSVDWIRLKQDLVFRGETDDPNNPIPRFNDWRPEFALGGSHGYTELQCQATDALLLSSEAIVPFESGRIEQWGVAAAFEHSDRLRSHVTYRETRVYDDRMLGLGLDYRLTPKYDLRLTQFMNLGAQQTGSFKAELDRKLAGGFFRFHVSVDELDGRTDFGLTFRLEGVGGGKPIFE